MKEQLTREQILVELNGRQLDAWVAKHFMYPSYCHPIEEVKEWCRKYSTELEASWTVVERLRSRNYHVEIKTTVTGWTAWLHGPQSSIHHAFGATAPEAICRVALLTTVEEVTTK